MSLVETNKIMVIATLGKKTHEKNTLILPHSSAKSLFQRFREQVDPMIDIGEMLLRVAG